MNNLTDPANSTAADTARTDSFYSGALARISRCMLMLAALAIIPIWIRYGAAICLGFACGCAVAYLNFVWLKRVISGLADRITRTW